MSREFPDFRETYVNLGDVQETIRRYRIQLSEWEAGRDDLPGGYVFADDLTDEQVWAKFSAAMGEFLERPRVGTIGDSIISSQSLMWRAEPLQWSGRLPYAAKIRPGSL